MYSDHRGGSARNWFVEMGRGPMDRDDGRCLASRVSRFPSGIAADGELDEGEAGRAGLCRNGAFFEVNRLFYRHSLIFKLYGNFW